MTSAALIAPYTEEPSEAASEESPSRRRLARGACVDVSVDGFEWHRMGPEVAILSMPVQAAKIREIVGNGKVL